ncbi:MAG: glycogen debranching protein, partial [Devosia sp.]
MSGQARFNPAGRAMTARRDGTLLAENAVLLPIMAPRLQGDFKPSGRLELAVWAGGSLATLSTTALTGPFIYSPNRVIATNGSLHVAQTAPVLTLRGARSTRVTPARRAAWWHDAGALPPPVVATDGARRIVTLAWGAIAIVQRGKDLVVAVGTNADEAIGALRLTVDQIVAEADAYCRLCDRMPEADPVLRSMVLQGTHASLSSIRQDEHGNFAGLAAGQAYSAPARTYFRDGYWTLQPLLKLRPEAVRDQIRLLATGIQPDGEAPSGVILSGPAQSKAWDAFRRSDKVYAGEHLRPGDWWSDHFDSPLFFVLTLGDYVHETGDFDEARRHWSIVKAIVDRYVRASGADGLPRKPQHDRDWADNVYRGGLVSYDIGLWVGALDAVVAMGGTLDKALATQAHELAAKARRNVGALWIDTAGNYADFINLDGFVEDHFALDSLTLLRYDAAPADRATEVLLRAAKVLESRNNREQPYGDW